MSLNGSTISTQRPTTDAKLTARGYRIDLHHHFVRALSRPVRQWRKLYRAIKQLCELSIPRPSDSLRRILAWWAVILRTLKNHKTVKLGGGRLHVYGRLPRTIRYHFFSLVVAHTHSLVVVHAHSLVVAHAHSLVVAHAHSPCSFTVD